jgi:hypothetical protein
VRKFAVTIQNLRYCTVTHYLVEAASPAAAEELLNRRPDLQQGDQIRWCAAESERYRDAWRDGQVIVLRDRKLPEGIE